jgi:molybdopterin synthase sulfur carrier subunit
MNVLYFAWVRQRIGRSEERIDLPAGVASVRALAGLLAARGGSYGEVFADLSKLRVAVNREHAALDAPIAEDDEVAFFPPVTGG